eukprot:CAMPEP_0171488998 /NCGR_PEP_ID=MMETSP0958-20121227/2513_1 /TAXON_ID=87120 /ORGANISM="Aurantiochytrium limacinum, Strain ATCCMYA-1381" /LENGTH=73 /DNA_ID=CAMNT_0012022163 /DNA_START=52 /DNA_END=273 /DNA_ORIENTATION=+
MSQHAGGFLLRFHQKEEMLEAKEVVFAVHAAFLAPGYAPVHAQSACSGFVAVGDLHFAPDSVRVRQGYEPGAG